MIEAIQVGEHVPDFTAETYEPAAGEFGEFSLEKQRREGRWTVLFFYPADFTFVCATEFAALADQHESFDRLGADVVTMSCDTKYTHLAWQQHEGELRNVRYVMGSDPTGRIARLFGVHLAEQGVALRGSFLIAPDATLMNAEVNFLNLGRNVEELLRKLKANLYLQDKPDEVCPSQWREAGDATLTPSARLVGNVHQALGRPKN